MFNVGDLVLYNKPESSDLVLNSDDNYRIKSEKPLLVIEVLVISDEIKASFDNFSNLHVSQLESELLEHCDDAENIFCVMQPDGVKKHVFDWEIKRI
jgi:hypothetical protein